jgi:hypothetical protein
MGLCDLEIEDDSREIPVAVIRVPGVWRVKITMLSEWHYYRHFIPLRNLFVSYYANRVAQDENIKDNSILMEKVKAFQNEISKIKETNNSEVLTYLFSDVAARYEFFKGLKRCGLLPWFITWRRWQKNVKPLHTCSIFAFLWLFNVDGLKKNVALLIERITQAMNTESPTASRIWHDLDSFKKAHAEAHARWLNNSNN